MDWPAMDETTALQLTRFPGAAEDMAFTGERYVPGIMGQIRVEHLHRYMFAVSRAAGCRVLDIACGEGYGSAALAQTASSVVGVDIAQDAIAHASARYTADNLRFVHGSLTSIPAADAAFDLVVCFETLEHVRDQELAIQEMRRVLRPEGLLIVSTPNRDAKDGALHEKNLHHSRELSEAEFRSMLAARFAHVSVMEQRFLHGSVIAGFDAPPTMAPGVIASDDMMTMRASTGDLGRFYLIALASDHPHEFQALSVFDGAAELQRLTDEFTYAVKTMQAQAAEIEELQAALQDMKTHDDLKKIQIAFLRKKLLKLETAPAS